MEIERLCEIRMNELEKLKNLIVIKYQKIYWLEGLDEDYIDAFFKEVKEEILG